MYCIGILRRLRRQISAADPMTFVGARFLLRQTGSRGMCGGVAQRNILLLLQFEGALSAGVRQTASGRMRDSSVPGIERALHRRNGSASGIPHGLAAFEGHRPAMAANGLAGPFASYTRRDARCEISDDVRPNE
jgi:hypothetical protein